MRQTFAPEAAGSSPTGTHCDRRSEKTFPGFLGRRTPGNPIFNKGGRQGRGWPPPTSHGSCKEKRKTKKSTRGVVLSYLPQKKQSEAAGKAPPTQPPWFITKKGSRQDVVIAKKEGQAGRGIHSKNGKKAGCCSFFLRPKKKGRRQTGQGMATAHPALMVKKTKGSRAGRARDSHRPPNSHGSKEKRGVGGMFFF